MNLERVQMQIKQREEAKAQLQSTEEAVAKTARLVDVTHRRSRAERAREIVSTVQLTGFVCQHQSEDDACPREVSSWVFIVRPGFFQSLPEYTFSPSIGCI